MIARKDCTCPCHTTPGMVHVVACCKEDNPMTDTTRESVEELYDGPCEAGCQHYHGGEVRHHRDCGHYPESFSKMFDDCAAERDSLLSELDAARTALAAAEAREKALLDSNQQERSALVELNAMRTKAEAAEAREGELMEALEPFAWIGQWMFARDLPDDTPVVEITGITRSFTLTRGMFKASSAALKKGEGQ